MAEDLHQLRHAAEEQLRNGGWDEAVDLLLRALAQTHVSEKEYCSLLPPLAAAYEKLGDMRSALSVIWYNAIATGRERTLLPHVPPIDRGRTFASLGKYLEAASEMELAGRVAAAAIYREYGKDDRGAQALWSRLAQTSLGKADAYSVALVHFNLARAAKRCGDAARAREAMIVSVRLLEEAADHFESVGQRERAFDCFQVLVQVGRESGMFEDVLEGYVNCIRILREDHLKYFALQYYDDAVGQADKKNEKSAAATLAREASAYARTVGLQSVRVFYAMRQGALWKQAAQQKLDQGAPAAIAENALLAAIVAYGEAGRFQEVGQAYESLSTLDLEEARKKHYARAAVRYRDALDARTEVAGLPSYLKHDQQFPEVWHVDVLEWEERGSASEACADILLDRKWPELIRRRALIARLSALRAERAAPEDSEALLRQLAIDLSQVQIFSILSPLEKMFEHPNPGVKVAVLAAMRSLFFKRTFVTVRAALQESNMAVLEQAARTIEALHFAHAFDPLARIVREGVHAKARTSAIKALSRVDTREAAEFLVGLLDYGTPQDRDAAKVGLAQARGTQFIELARAVMPASSPALQAILRDVVQSRGA